MPRAFPRSAHALALATALFSCVATASAAAYPPPPAWPAQHYHREMMYTPATGVWNNKPFFYDWTNKHLRVDSLYVGGPKLPPFNFTSYWLNDDLYMYLFDGNASCFHLSMGFGMMRPDWFTDGDQLNTTWLAKKSDATDDGFHNTVWTRKCATCDTDPNGYFNYFSTTGDNGDKAGVPFSLEAPGPIVYLINEYYDFEATTWGADSDIFALPPGLSCSTKDVEYSTKQRILAIESPAEQARAMRAAKVAVATELIAELGVAFPELLMAMM